MRTRSAFHILGARRSCGWQGPPFQEIFPAVNVPYNFYKQERREPNKVNPDLEDRTANRMGLRHLLRPAFRPGRQNNREAS